MVDIRFGRQRAVFRRSWGRVVKDFVRHRMLHSSFLIFVAFCGLDWIVEDPWGDLLLNACLYVAFESWRKWRAKP